MSNLLIGTSGYDYPEWKGVFYPQDLKRKDFLKFYATQFNALELNNTFYNMPTAERLYSFYERSEGKLQFSVKANRLLTHEIDSTWQTAAEDFKTALTPLQGKDALSAVLFQLPESFHYTNDNRIYLAKLIQKFEGYPTLIEFRHREWIKESVFEGLEKRNAGLVFCDMPQLKNLPYGMVGPVVSESAWVEPVESERPLSAVGGFGRRGEAKNSPNAVVEPVETTYTPFIGTNAYIRLHGRNANAWYAHVPKAQTSIISTHANGAKATYAAAESHNGSARYCYDYSEDELSQFVPIIKAAVREGKKVQVYFNNHPNGSGAKNGLKLKEMVSMGIELK